MAGPFLLLVEDNPDDQLLTLRALRKHAIAENVVVASDGDEALSHLLPDVDVDDDDEPDLPALVLLDLKLPGTDGLEVLQRIKSNQRTKRVPVVVLTSSREERDIARCYDYGANSYIRKPVDFLEFMDVARDIQSYWLKLNERPPVAA